jgi:hypothetical protein
MYRLPRSSSPSEAYADEGVRDGVRGRPRGEDEEEDPRRRRRLRAGEPVDDSESDMAFMAFSCKGGLNEG